MTNENISAYTLCALQKNNLGQGVIQHFLGYVIEQKPDYCGRFWFGDLERTVRWPAAEAKMVRLYREGHHRALEAYIGLAGRCWDFSTADWTDLNRMVGDLQEEVLVRREQLEQAMRDQGLV